MLTNSYYLIEIWTDEEDKQLRSLVETYGTTNCKSFLLEFSRRFTCNTSYQLELQGQQSLKNYQIVLVNNAVRDGTTTWKRELRKAIGQRRYNFFVCLSN